MLQQITTLQTPLLRQIERFGQWLSVIILIAAAFTFLIGVVVYGHSASEMFLAGVALAVAAIPEALPAVMTITLAIGVERMARRKALIRRLPAVETLGSVTVICSDKTGTLTRNEMTVQSIATSRHLFDVTRTGLEPHGEFLLAGKPVELELHPLVRQLVHGAVLCNDAFVASDGDDWTVHGDPMEGALLVAAIKAGLEPEEERAAWPRTDEIPFDSEYRFMATLHDDHEGNSCIYVKGAPERILEMCSKQRDIGGDAPLDAGFWQAKFSDVANRGDRVLALAIKETEIAASNLSLGDVDSDFTLLGVFGLVDPPREEAIQAVEYCHSAGIDVKMITGDHAGTAKAIAQKLGLHTDRGAVTGYDLDRMKDEELAERVVGIDVFARTSPQQKLRLVETLQRAGHVVAMTGDGVNDAPALKRADIGVAMGKKGTAAARESGDMVLADDNFASIAAAVEEGRVVYDNIRKTILFILPTSGGEALIIMAAVIFNWMLPITPVQILWVNMVTAVTLGLALAFEPAETDVMQRPPRAPNEPILSGFLAWRVALVSLVIVMGVFGIFTWLQAGGADIEFARTAAVNTLVLFEIFYLFNTRRITSSAFGDILTSAARPTWIAVVLVLALQLAYTYVPVINAIFHSTPIDVGTWGVLTITAASVLFVVEFERWLVAKHTRAASSSVAVP